MPAWNCPACGSDNQTGTRFCGHCGAPRQARPAETPEPASETAVADALRSFVIGEVADRLAEEGGRLPEERRLITALFADISGFTALAERLGDPEQLMEVIDPVITALSSIVGRYEGYVEKFAGDAVLALFGAPVSHEDDADRALLVALEMHRELELICADLPHDPELTLHVGVNSGHGMQTNTTTNRAKAVPFRNRQPLRRYRRRRGYNHVWRSTTRMRESFDPGRSPLATRPRLRDDYDSPGSTRPDS